MYKTTAIIDSIDFFLIYVCQFKCQITKDIQKTNKCFKYRDDLWLSCLWIIIIIVVSFIGYLTFTSKKLCDIF